jgi:signal transduction histidine kinase
MPFALMLGAVALGVGIGGLSPAFLATARGYGATDLLFVQPRGELKLVTTGDWTTLAGYLFACTTIIVLGTLMRRAHRRLRAYASGMEALNVSKDELLAMVAHELRQPLTPLHNVVQSLNAQAAAATVPAQAVGSERRILERQVGNLTRLVHDLGDLDRLSRGQVELRLERLSLGEVLGSAVGTCRPLFDQKRQVFEWQGRDRTMLVDGDPMRLEQVFVNLLHNAVKFTPPGGSILLEEREEDGTAAIRVHDTGIGLAADTAPHVFDMFYQREHRPEGSGIGLAVVRRLVLLHRGTVAVRSAGPGRGCDFLVRLPLAARVPAGSAAPKLC